MKQASTEARKRYIGFLLDGSQEVHSRAVHFMFLLHTHRTLHVMELCVIVNYVYHLSILVHLCYFYSIYIHPD
jgi:hypothetical protein